MPGLSAALIVFALLALPATAADPPTAEGILRGYEEFSSYCDEVEVVGSDAGRYQRCFTADGRYRTVERIFWTGPHTYERWGDGTRHFRWEHRDGETNQYSETAPEFEKRRPDAILGVFLDTISASYELQHYYRPREWLDGHWLFEKEYQGAVVGRIWVRGADGLIVRSLKLWKGKVVREAALKSVRLNEDLGPRDLTSPVPLLTRYSLIQRPVIFVVSLALASFVLGAAAWAFKRDFPVNWRGFLKVALALGAASFALTLLCLVGKDSGHPPAIVFALMFDALLGLFLVFAASFLLAITLMNRLFMHKRQT